MVLFTFTELLHLVIMTLALGYIFMSYIKRPQSSYYGVSTKQGFDWDNFKFAIIITAPAVILHELAHKFVALAFGLQAVFKAWFFGLVIGVVLKLVHSPFILVAPGFVQIGSATDPLILSLVAFAGPFINLALFGISHYVLHHKKRLTQKQAMAWYLTRQINLFLFIFNMLPLPPLDGSKVFGGLWNFFF